MKDVALLIGFIWFMAWTYKRLYGYPTKRLLDRLTGKEYEAKR